MTKSRQVSAGTIISSWVWLVMLSTALILSGSSTVALADESLDMIGMPAATQEYERSNVFDDEEPGVQDTSSDELTMPEEDGNETTGLTIEAIPSDPDAKEILPSDVTAPADQIFSGFPLIPELVVRVGDIILQEGTDYEVSYTGNTNVGTATVYVEGSWHYAGLVSVTFDILPQDIANAEIRTTDQRPSIWFNGLELVEGRDYTIDCDNGTTTVVGIGNFDGSRTVLSDIEPLGQATFLDVTSSTAHYNEVMWLANQRISEGWTVSGGREFRPYDEIKRADMAAFLFRLARNWGLVTDAWQPSGTVSFVDVTSQTAHYREVMWLAEEKISEGWPVTGGREFRPFSKIVRADMAAFICRLARKAGKYDWAQPAAMGFFRDVNSSTAHLQEVLWLAGSKISAGWGSGTTREFRPYSTAKRADMAAFLYRLDALSEPSGDDEPDTPTENMVLITKTGKKYHRLSGCRSTAGKAVTQVSLEEALARGLEPCKNCYH